MENTSFPELREKQLSSSSNKKAPKVLVNCFEPKHLFQLVSNMLKVRPKLDTSQN